MTRRLLFWFLLIAIAPVLIAVVVIYFQRAESIKTEAYSKLSAIRDLKVRKLEWWLEHRVGDLRSIAAHLSDVDVEALLDAGRATPPDRLARIRRILTPYVVNYHDYRELSVIDARTGRAWVSTKPEREGLTRTDRAYFSDPIATRQLFLSDIYMSKTERIPVMEVSVPVFCDQHDGEHVVAVLAARIDLENSLYRLLGEPVGLGLTGETVLVNRDRMVLNELRLHPDAPLKLKVQSRPGVLAAQGETGVTVSRDYRDIDVFAAYSHIPTTGWGIVIKQNLAELHQPIDRMLWQLAIAMVLLALVVSVAAVLLARSTTAPVLAIAEVARKIRRGDVAARCSTSQGAELAAMGRSINEMADSLVAQAEIQGGIAEISEAMVVATTVSGFASRQLGTLMKVTGSHLAGFFRYDHASASFHHVASLGMDAELLRPFRSDVLEGQLAGGLGSRQISFIDDISPDTVFKFRTVAGEALPKELATIPLLERNEVVAVITLGTLSHYSKQQRKILRLSWAGQNAAFANILAGERSDLMAAELRTRNRELGETNRALELQSARLREQAAKLTKLAAELDMRRAQVEEAGRLKSEFLSNMSHELRTPLNSIIALSQLMLSHGPGSNRDKETEFVQIIERNGRELLALINDILDLSRVEAGRLDVQSMKMSPRDVVNAAIETIMPAVEEKQLELRLEVIAAPEIRSDEGRIRQIMLNLLANAVKFTDSGHIDVAIDASSQSVFFSVSDTGIGIAQDNLEAIFDEFRQVDGSTTRSHGGSGLGLAICAKLASLLGGSIGVESELGSGSCFTLTLPRRPGDARDSSPDARSHASEAPDTRPMVLAIDDDAATRDILQTGQAPVLVVEDNPDNMVTITAILEEMGVAYVGAENGEAAVQLAEELRPRLVLMDIQLPVMSGLEAAQRIKAHADLRAIPIVALTARAMKGDRERMLAAGCDDYLAKPIEHERLQATVRRWLDRAAAGPEPGCATGDPDQGVDPPPA